MISGLDDWISGSEVPTTTTTRATPAAGRAGGAGAAQQVLAFWGECWVVCFGECWVVCWLFGKMFKCLLMVETLGQVTVMLTHCVCGLIHFDSLALIQGRETREVLNAIECH